MPRLNRRSALAAGLAFAASPAWAAASPELAELERRSGGRLGVYAWRAGRVLLAHRAEERFPMCSTFKLALAASVLSRADSGQEDLDAMVPYGEADLLGVAPVSRANVGKGALPVKTLCQAAVETSDNTAANLLLKRSGGPAALTAWLRRIGDPSTRLDRFELDLNVVPDGDPRDTTTPEAMTRTLQSVLLGDALKPASRERLLAWMKAATPGLKRLRAGLPSGWTAGDKTGTGPASEGSVNDIGLFQPPAGAPVLASVYLVRGKGGTADLERIHADIGRMIAARAA